MKNNVLKYYITAFYFCSTFAMLAQDPGAGGVDNGDGSGDTTPAAPIDDYVWVLALVGLVFVFLKFRAIQKRKINS